MDSKTIQAITAAIIAIVVVVGTMGILAYQIVNHQAPSLPSELDILLGGVVGSYFTHTAAVNGARQAGVAAAQAAVTAATDAAKIAPNA